MNLRDRLLALSGRNKRALLLTADIPLIWLAVWLAFYLRLGDADSVRPFAGHAWVFICAPLICLPIFIRLGLYRAVMRYLGSDALKAIAKAITLASLLLALVVYWYRSPPEIVPRSMVFNFWWLSLLLVGGSRLALRHYFMGDWRSMVTRAARQKDDLPRVAIYGAGAAGNQLVAALRLGRVMRPVAFIDDDPGIANRVIAGLPVFAPSQLHTLIETTGANQILLAVPSASRARRREILTLLEGWPLQVRTVPGFMDLASGRVKVDDIQEVDIADLLGREAVPPRAELLERCIRGKVVMVTGAGGSIGAELCRQILGSGPTTLVMFDAGEFNLYSIDSELTARIEREALHVRLVATLGNVRDLDRLQDVIATWHVDTVYHAAAYKHVPMVEHNVAEGVFNNLIGTLNAAQAAIRLGVANFVLVSTDKAVRPTNIMGGSKRLAEMVLQALSHEVAPVLFGDRDDINQVNKTRFTMVRFGNVLGSSGSVIPLFREQIRRGGPLTVTHPNITRYFMTIPEASQLVIQAGSMGQGGDVFVLDMGKPVKILELAEKMVHLAGLSIRSETNPSGDIAIQFTGLRPGEKLYEELLIGEQVTATDHPMIMRAQEDCIAWPTLKLFLDELLVALRRHDYDQVRRLLRQTVNGYAPQCDIVDWMHQQRRETPKSGEI